MGMTNPPDGGSGGGLGRLLHSAPQWVDEEVSRVEPEKGGWWSVEQAAEVSGLSKWVVRKLCRGGGHFVARRPGRRWQIESSSFVAWLLESYR